MPWDDSYDLNQGGQPSAAGQPMSLAPPAADQNAGAGWKQGLQKVAGAIGNAAGNFQISNGQVQPQKMTDMAAPQQPQQQPQNMYGLEQRADPTGMMQRAMQLMKQGVISPQQFAHMTGQNAPGFADAIMKDGVNLGPQPQGLQSVAPPTGPTSPAWGR